MLRNIRIGILSTIFLGVFINGRSQDLSFKDIFPFIETGNYAEAVPRLKAYLKEEPDDPAANLQLAVIFKKRFEKYHPLNQYHDAINNANDAKTYFLKAGLNIDEKEIRRNGKKYYTNFARPDSRGKLDVTYNDVKAYIDSSYIEIDNFLRSMPDIYTNFTSAVSYYDHAAGIYDSLAAVNDNISDLLISFDGDIDGRLVLMKNYYDSCVYFLKKYLDETALFPIYRNQQTLKTREIKVFRLDGTGTGNPGFMDSTIYLWDYGSWADKIREKGNGEISNLNKSLFATEEKLRAGIELLSDPGKLGNTEPDLTNPDADLIIKLRNYDQNSVLISLLQYQERKQDLLLHELNDHKIHQDTLFRADEGSLSVNYAQLFQKSLECKDLLNRMEEKSQESDLRNYKAFIFKFFSGSAGFRQYLKDEENFTSNSINSFSEKLEDLTKPEMPDRGDSASYAVFNKIRIPLFITKMDPSSLKQDETYSLELLRTPENGMLISGIIQPKKGNGSVNAFLAKIDSVKNDKWMTTVTDSAIDNKRIVFNRVAALSLASKGYAVILNSKIKDDSTATNSYHLIGEDGRNLVNANLPESDWPSQIQFNGNTRTCIVIFKGRKAEALADNEEPFTWAILDENGIEKNKNQASLAGNIAFVSGLGKGYLVMGNYTKFTGPDQAELDPGKHGDWACFGLLLDQEGKVIKTASFAGKVDCHLYGLRMINDNFLSLILQHGKYMPGSHINISRNDMDHYLLNGKLEILNKNIR